MGTRNFAESGLAFPVVAGSAARRRDAAGMMAV